MVARRTFFSCTGALLCLPLVGCGTTAPGQQAAPQAQPARRADLVLQEEEIGELARIVHDHIPTLRELVQKPGSTWTVWFPLPTGSQEGITFRVQEKRGVPYRSLQLQRESDRAQVDMLWTTKHQLPAVRLVKAQGDVIATVGLHDLLPADAGQPLTPQDLVSLGVKAVALGLLVWLGASVSRAVLSVLATLALLAMALGLLAVGAGIVAPFLGQLLARTGLRREDLDKLLQLGQEELRRLLAEVMRFLQGCSGEDLARCLSPELQRQAATPFNRVAEPAVSIPG
jgi:hypothetical protein